MQSYKVTVAYDGTDYHGWQWQPNSISVDGTLRDSFAKAFADSQLLMVGASRTDSGVHAQGQVVRVRIDVAITPEKLLYAWNNALPDDIIIKDIVPVDEHFHPQHGVKSKTYQYTFYTKRCDPTVQRFSLFLPYQIDFKALQEALSLFVGEHNFKAFCKEEEGRCTVRKIDSIDFFQCEKTGKNVITVVGKSFLRYMIRRIVGAAFAVACRPDVTIQDLQQSLVEKKLSKMLRTASGKGLCLKKIEYQSY